MKKIELGKWHYFAVLLLLTLFVTYLFVDKKNSRVIFVVQEKELMHQFMQSPILGPRPIQLLPVPVCDY